MKKTTVSYVISNVNKTLAFEWISRDLDGKKINMHFILLNPGESELENYLKMNNIPVDRVLYRGKKDILKSIRAVYIILKKQKSNIVHAHLFDGSIIGITAAWLLRIKKRIYTRHHSNYHHNYFPHAVKYDKLVNSLSTDIIAISQVVKEILIEKENVPEEKIHLIHHGFELKDFKTVPESSINKLRQKYINGNSTPVIGVISRYIEWKGIQYTIAAFEKLLIKYPDAFLVLANANGSYTDHIRVLLQRIPAKNYIEIPFESDIFSLYKLFDMFVHVPIDAEAEAFGQTYVEVLAVGIPSIFTLSGIARDFIIDRQNALVVPFKDSEAIYNSMIELLENKKLKDILITNAERDVFSRFNLSKMILSLEQLYDR